MRIAIIIPAFNVAPFVGETIQSVLEQTHRDWDLLVVDDGSTDATAAVAGGFSDPRIRLLQQAHAGVSAARNHGLHQAGAADAVLFLDGDDWLRTRWRRCLIRWPPRPGPSPHAGVWLELAQTALPIRQARRQTVVCWNGCCGTIISPMAGIC